MTLMFGFGKERDKIQKGKQNNVFNTETMLPVSEIRGDTMIMKDGGIRAVLKITGLNIDLRNYDEQELVVEQYKKFLNGLDFPIQILVRNTYLELSDYISYMKNHVSHIDHDLLKEQGEGYIQFLDDINVRQGLIFVKEFYIVVPYYPLEDDEPNVAKPWWRKFMDAFSTVETPEKIVGRYRSYLRNNKYLDTRVNVISESLKGSGIYAERQGMTDLIGLLFKCYNPDAHKDQAIMAV